MHIIINNKISVKYFKYYSSYTPVFNGGHSFLFSCRQGLNSSCLAIKIHRLHCQMSELSMTLEAFGFWLE